MRVIAFIRIVAIVGTLAACLLLAGFLIYSSYSARVESERPRMGQAGSAKMTISRTHGRNATSVAVMCHHYFHEDTRPRDIPSILGAIMLNLPVVGRINPWTQSASSFEQEIRLLKEQGYTAVGLDDVAAWKAGKKTLPEKSVVITFDDGDRSVLEIAYPILKRYGMKATLFIVTGEVGEEWQGVEGLTWRELRFLESTGVFTVESHSNNLHYKVKTSRGPMPVALAMSAGLYVPSGGLSWQKCLVRDLVESRQKIARHLGHDARHLAWPYGIANTAVDSLASIAGFRTRLTINEGLNTRSPIRRVVYRRAPMASSWGWWGERMGGFAVAPHATEPFDAVRATLPLTGPEPGRGFELKRYAITSRTSIRTYARFLEGGHSGQKLSFGSLGY